MVEGEILPVETLRATAVKFIVNPKNLPEFPESPKNAVIALQCERGTKYEAYLRVYNELQGAYSEIRNLESKQRYQRPFDQLSYQEKKQIREAFPMLISESEPFDAEALWE